MFLTDHEFSTRCLPSWRRRAHEAGVHHVRPACGGNPDGDAQWVSNDMGSVRFFGSSRQVKSGGGRRAKLNVTRDIGLDLMKQKFQRRCEDFILTPAPPVALKATLRMFGHSQSIRDMDDPDRIAEMAWAFLDAQLQGAGLEITADVFCSFNASSGPGEAWRLAGVRTKMDAITSFDRVGWRGYYERLEGKHPPQLVHAGSRARLQDWKDGEPEDRKKGRLVWEIGVEDMLALNRYTQPLIHLFDRNFCLGAAVSVNQTQGGLKRAWEFLKQGNEGYHYVAFDRSQYDSSIWRHTITRALWCIRLAFGHTSEEYDAFFEYALCTLCAPIIALPDGGIWSAIHGTCTGHPWVQPIQCMITWVATITGLTRYRMGLMGEDARTAMTVVLRDTRTLTLGDDQITVSQTMDLSCSMDELARLEALHFGHKVNAMKSDYGELGVFSWSRSLNEGLRGPGFLGYYYIQGHTWRPLSELLLKLVVPEHSGPDLCDELVRLCAYRLVWWTNIAAVTLINWLIYNLYPSVELRLKEAIRRGDKLQLSHYWGSIRATYEYPGFEGSLGGAIVRPMRNWDVLVGEGDCSDLDELSWEEARHFLHRDTYKMLRYSMEALHAHVVPPAMSPTIVGLGRSVACQFPRSSWEEGFRKVMNDFLHRASRCDGFVFDSLGGECPN